MIYDMIYLLTAIGLTPSGNSTVHIYTQTIHRTTQSTQTIHRTTQLTNWEECGPCPVFASYILAFALQLRKKHGETSVRVAEECQLPQWKQNIQNRAYIITLENSCFSDGCLKPNTQLVMWLDALCLNMIPTLTTSHGFYELCIYSVMDGSKNDIL
jgi:hypothetical protein